MSKFLTLEFDPVTNLTQRTQNDLSAAGTARYTSPEKIYRDDVKKVLICTLLALLSLNP